MTKLYAICKRRRVPTPGGGITETYEYRLPGGGWLPVTKQNGYKGADLLTFAIAETTKNKLRDSGTDAYMWWVRAW